jgi:hypothetical protein
VLRAAISTRAHPPGAEALGAAVGQLAEWEADLRDHLHRWVRPRVSRLLRVLDELSLPSVSPEGGLFVATDLSRLEGSLFSGTDVWGRTIGPARPASLPSFRETVFDAARILLQPDYWSGWSLPHRRIVPVVTKLDDALVRLRALVTTFR